MKLIKSIFRFYIDSSIHVALAICALMVLHILSYGLNLDKWELIFVFTASVSAYNFSKCAENVGFHYYGLSSYLKAIQFFSFACFLILLYASFQVSSQFLWMAGFLALITVLYSLPFLPIGFKLRNFKGLKIFIIALVWTGTVLWLPLAELCNLLSWDVFWRSLSLFFIVLALILPFEIRDLKVDSPDLKTIPQGFGVENAKKIGYAFVGLFVVFNLINPSFSIKEKAICVSIGFLVAGLLNFSKTANSEYYASFWVESVPIFWLLLYVLF